MAGGHLTFPQGRDLVFDAPVVFLEDGKTFLQKLLQFFGREDMQEKCGDGEDVGIKAELQDGFSQGILQCHFSSIGKAVDRPVRHISCLFGGSGDEPFFLQRFQCGIDGESATLNHHITFM